MPGNRAPGSESGRGSDPEARFSGWLPRGGGACHPRGREGCHVPGCAGHVLGVTDGRGDTVIDDDQLDARLRAADRGSAVHRVPAVAFDAAAARLASRRRARWAVPAVLVAALAVPLAAVPAAAVLRDFAAQSGEYCEGTECGRGGLAEREYIDTGAPDFEDWLALQAPRSSCCPPASTGEDRRGGARGVKRAGRRDRRPGSGVPVRPPRPLRLGRRVDARRQRGRDGRARRSRRSDRDRGDGAGLEGRRRRRHRGESRAVRPRSAHGRSRRRAVRGLAVGLRQRGGSGGDRGAGVTPDPGRRIRDLMPTCSRTSCGAPRRRRTPPT